MTGQYRVELLDATGQWRPLNPITGQLQEAVTVLARYRTRHPARQFRLTVDRPPWTEYVP